MSQRQRQRKRKINGLFHNRHYNPRFIWWSAEDFAWCNLAPVGREFGSPDYDRLMQQDFERMTDTLARLVSNCSKETGQVPEASEFVEGTSNVKLALWELGHNVDSLIAARVWRHCSNSLLAGWMHEAETIESARMSILGYCALGTLDHRERRFWSDDQIGHGHPE